MEKIQFKTKKFAHNINSNIIEYDISKTKTMTFLKLATVISKVTRQLIAHSNWVYREFPLLE